MGTVKEAQKLLGNVKIRNFPCIFVFLNSQKRTNSYSHVDGRNKKKYKRGINNKQVIFVHVIKTSLLDLIRSIHKYRQVLH